MTDEPNDQAAQAPKQQRPRRTPAQEMAYLQQRMAQLKTAESKRLRKVDTQQKIIVGGAIMKAMHDDPEWRERVAVLLNANVTRPDHREAIAPWLSAT